MRLEYVLFDFDGTIADTSEGIIKSVAYALEKFGIKAESEAELYRFIGPPLYDSFVDFYGFSHDAALEAVRLFRERYAKTGIYETKLYDGIEELLRELCACGLKPAIVSSKPEEMIKQLLQLYSINDCFCFVAGAVGMDRRTKNAVMDHAVNTCGAVAEAAVMIGDRKYDIEAATLFGMSSIGVTFGFGSEDELKASGADIIAHSVKELKQIISGLCNKEL